MTKPTPSPCDKCPVRATCQDTCEKWVKWLFSPQSESKYRQEMLK